MHVEQVKEGWGESFLTGMRVIKDMITDSLKSFHIIEGIDGFMEDFLYQGMLQLKAGGNILVISGFHTGADYPVGKLNNSDHLIKSP